MSKPSEWTASACPVTEVRAAIECANGVLPYHRQVTSALWNYDYAWEVYTPPAQRVRGYYALPVLAGAELVGHVDPKADRPARRLHGISRSVKRGHEIAVSVGNLARWLGLK